MPDLPLPLEPDLDGHSVVAPMLGEQDEGSSLPSIPAIKEASPATAIVVLTMESEPAFAREALRAGALGYVLKEAADDEPRSPGTDRLALTARGVVDRTVRLQERKGR